MDVGTMLDKLWNVFGNQHGTVTQSRTVPAEKNSRTVEGYTELRSIRKGWNRNNTEKTCRCYTEQEASVRGGSATKQDERQRL